MQKSLIFLLFITLGLQAKSTKYDIKLESLLTQWWEYSLSRSPQRASSVGEMARGKTDAKTDAKIGQSSQLDDVSGEYQLQTAKGLHKLLNQIKEIQRNKLSVENKINYDMAKDMLGGRIADIHFNEYQFPITSEGSFHVDLARLADNMQFNHNIDYENYLNKLQQIPRVFKQHIANMRNGLATGMTQPQIIIQHYPEFIEKYISQNPQDSVFYKPFIEINKNVTQQQASKLQIKAQKIIQSQVMPAYKSFKTFMQQEYIPAAKTDIGAYSFPNGKAYYQQQIKEYTTLDLTPQEINAIGWQEVKRIRAEMEEIIKQVEFVGNFAEFLHFLRTDERFYAKSAADLLKEASYIAKKMDGKLPALFSKLPRQPYTVNPVPAQIAANYTIGRYVPAPLHSTRPGQYWVNTYALEKRPLYNLEALTFHEAVPGHHLQIALSKELQNLPKFRRYNYISAYGEGWGLYCEKLAKEVGFYTDPYSDFGRLTYEMWRAMRLVVDTGIHAFGMSRAEAIKLMEDNTALSKHNVLTEIDRYIGWPGQALSYKLGEIKIWELRAKAEKELGDKFDIRTFHDALLAKGSVPLNVLEQIIDTHIQEMKK
ncbi:MAG: DUF885 domain-containing protein [Proteobacteria bacterium]|nr:DUF885 domain-containing protein [Pseudomonadota bacterium]